MIKTAIERSHFQAQRTSALRLSPVAVACASMLIATGSVWAQAAKLNTVTVTGIRQGIESAIAIKRDSDSIVEVISAEDLGKLPDASIADSIARLPGVTAKRGESGRATSISVRGLGPDYAGAVLNGREVVSSGDGRAAEYDQFPSELVGKVLVYKSPDAALMGQGLSGTIDIRPVMPLDFKGRQMSISVRGEQNANGGLTANGNGANGSRFSASYIDQFGEGTVGLAFGFAHLDSPGQDKTIEMWKYGDYGQWGQASLKPAGTVYSQGFEARVTSSKQARDGVMAVVEFKPNKDYHSTLDLYYSQFKQDRAINQWTGNFGLWGGNGDAVFTNQVVSEFNGNSVLTSANAAGGAYNIIDQKTFSRDDKISSLGWRNELKLANKWTAMADVGYSKATRDERAIESIARATTYGTFKLSGLTSNGGQVITTNQNLTGSTVMQLTNDPDWSNLQIPTYTDEIRTLRLSAKRDLEGVFSGVEGGFNYSERDKTVFKGEFALKLSNPDAKGFVPIPAGALRGTTNISVAGINTDLLSWSVPDVMGLYAASPRNPWGAKDNNYGVHEKVVTAYGKLNVDSDVGSVPVRGNVGVQVVRADQKSDGFAWNDAGGTPGAAGASVVAVSGGANYTDVLPSLNLNFSLKPDLIARFGLSKAMARPRMDDMRAGADQPKLSAIAPGSNIGTWSAGNGGKPDLEPWRAKAIDFSLEKYFGKTSYIAGAAFYKDLESFIYNQSTLRDFSGFPNYSKLTPGCSNANPNCNPNLGTITTQANGKGGKVWGFELSAALDGSMLSSALAGFGVIASEAWTRNDLPKDNNGNEIYLDGFSAVVNNLTLYYERDGFSTRVSRRYRAPFSSSSRSVQMNTETNVQYGEESQVDFQMGYAFNEGTYKGMSILFQINNLTDPATVLSQSPEVGGNGGLTPWRYSTYGRAYMLGLTYKF